MCAHSAREGNLVQKKFCFEDSSLFADRDRCACEMEYHRMVIPTGNLSLRKASPNEHSVDSIG